MKEKTTKAKFVVFDSNHDITCYDGKDIHDLQHQLGLEAHDVLYDGYNGPHGKDKVCVQYRINDLMVLQTFPLINESDVYSLEDEIEDLKVQAFDARYKVCMVRGKMQIVEAG